MSTAPLGTRERCEKLAQALGYKPTTVHLGEVVEIRTPLFHDVHVDGVVVSNGMVTNLGCQTVRPWSKRRMRRWPRLVQAHAAWGRVAETSTDPYAARFARWLMRRFPAAPYSTLIENCRITMEPGPDPFRDVHSILFGDGR